MLRIQSVANVISTRKRAWSIIAIWLTVIVLLSALSPSSKSYAVQTGEGSAFNASLSEEASQILAQQFPSDNGLPALFVFHRSEGMTKEDIQHVAQWSKWLASDQRPAEVTATLPFHQLPEAAQNAFLSKDRTTLLFHVSLKQGMDTKVLGTTLDKLTDQANSISSQGLELNVTGPAGIAADTSRLFRNADFVLMAATVALILVLLILIYRSPLLAILPLLIAGVVYQGVDRTLGLFGMNGWMTIDRSATSIMLVLLFAVLTDYCLFIFSRYREELRGHPSQFVAMQQAVKGVAEAILFSGGTILIAMLVLFGTVFKPYHAFAGVFTIAILWMIAAGLTLIPAVFAVAGRTSFWPLQAKVRFEPANQHQVNNQGIWYRISQGITKRPRTIALVMLIVLAAIGTNAFSMKYSYNLLHSFPKEMGARVGFEQMSEAYPPGQLAPVTVLVEAANKPADAAALQDLTTKLKLVEQNVAKQKGVYSFSWSNVRGNGPNKDKLAWSTDGTSLTGQLIIDGDPYSVESINQLAKWRQASAEWLKDADLAPSDYKLHFAGQTAVQADVQQMNNRDTMFIFVAITITLLLMLTALTRSISTSVIMVGTMLLSYATTLGASWFIFQQMLGLDAISYRLPVYTLLFMVALGIDYSIMLVTRIREEAQHYSWKDAVQRGVFKTGGVISSAGVILAATFGVLSTQPLQELMLFGATMVLGILLDTFFIRGILLPALFIGFEGLFTNRKQQKSNHPNRAQSS
ncbi:MMPL family transporter [Paenibacillus taiwanensis]|uniref:MMPL family transporter n=1 Tax=Paenibacillus taiwanensis TaxID=401638 RepID=UPI0004180D0B|nr:MMPL family transporter [Paenibacillus taiwanensis]